MQPQRVPSSSRGVAQPETRTVVMTAKAYLEPFGYEVEGPTTWRCAPVVSLRAPRLSLAVDGHHEDQSHTFYTVRCRLEGGQGVIVWSGKHRLGGLRDGLHDLVTRSLRADYEKVFSNAPFAHRGGVPGTTVRLTRWMEALAAAANRGAIMPSTFAQVLLFLGAPELPDHKKLKHFLICGHHVDDPHASDDETGCDATNKHHAQIQELFLEEVSKHFEYECAERCLRLQPRGASGVELLQEVVLCHIENLEDNIARCDARGKMWDLTEERLVDLTPVRRENLRDMMLRSMEPALMRSLRAAAMVATCEGSSAVSALSKRSMKLETECHELLLRKTVATEEFEAVSEFATTRPAKMLDYGGSTPMHCELSGNSSTSSPSIGGKRHSATRGMGRRLLFTSKHNGVTTDHGKAQKA